MKQNPSSLVRGCELVNWLKNTDVHSSVLYGGRLIGLEQDAICSSGMNIITYHFILSAPTSLPTTVPKPGMSCTRRTE